MYVIKNGVSYTLPELSAFNGFQTKFRASAESKMFSHGGISVSDNKIDYRELELGVYIDGQNKNDYRAQVDELKQSLSRQNQQLYIEDDRYINIAGISQIQEEFSPGFYMVKGEVTFTLLALDPFIYCAIDKFATIQIIATDYQFTVVNPGNIDTPLTLTITADELCDQVVLINNTDNRVMNYMDAQFQASRVLKVSTANGTVTLDGNNSINNFSGTFLRLIPGSNVFTYQGGACTIRIDYLARWF